MTEPNDQDETTPGGSRLIVGQERQDDWTPPEGYAENCDLIQEHLTSSLGVCDNVFHEIISDAVHLDVLVYPPDEKRDFWVYVTSGMGDLRMAVPSDVDAKDWARAELIIALPPAWGEQVNASMQNPSGGDDHYWPIGLLKWLARYPHLANVWFSDGHTIPNMDNAPYCQHSRMNGAMIAFSSLLPEESLRLELPDGDLLNFFGVTLLYPEEMDYKLNSGFDALLGRLDKIGVNEILDLKRKSVVKRNPILQLFGRN